MLYVPSEVDLPERKQPETRADAAVAQPSEKPTIVGWKSQTVGLLEGRHLGW